MKCFANFEYGTCPNFFHKFHGSISLYLRQQVEIRTIITNYETTLIFTFEKLANAYVLYQIKTVYIPDTSNLSNKSDAANESDKSDQINLTV